MNKDIEWRTWEPSSWQAHNGFTVSLDRCRYSIWGRAYNHQCSRKPKGQIQGYGFCTQHLKKLREIGYEEDKEEEAT